MAFLKSVALALAFQQLAAATVPTKVSEAEIALITVPPTVVTIGSPPTLITVGPTRVFGRRGLFSDLTSAADSYVNSVFSELGTDLPSYVASGILPGFIGIPTGSNVLKSANVSSTDLSATPTQVLNLPNYGNWTENGWNLRLRANVYKQPSISNETIDKLANEFLIGTSIQELPPTESDQAANLTREIYVVQQGNATVTFNLNPVNGSGTVGQQIITLPGITTAEGDIDSFIQLQNISGDSLVPGNGTVKPQPISLHVQGTDTGNATSYLVSTTGMTIISDIDDILRVTKIYEPKEGLLNSFARPFRPWLNMPDIYQNWSTSLPDMHFHYLTTTPEQITRNYMQFIYDTYPGGTFDTRPLNFSDLSETLSVRKYLLIKAFETFPHRKFILIADTSNSDVMRDYPQMATMFPTQVQCIFLRNTTATDPGDKFPYNTQGFEGLNQNKYMFFLTPDDLTNLDIANGQCWNTSIQQNVTFGYQGLPFGLSGTNTCSSCNLTSNGTVTNSGSGRVSTTGGVGVWALFGLAWVAGAMVTDVL